MHILVPHTSRLSSGATLLLLVDPNHIENYSKTKDPKSVNWWETGGNISQAIGRPIWGTNGPLPMVSL